MRLPEPTGSTWRSKMKTTCCPIARARRCRWRRRSGARRRRCTLRQVGCGKAHRGWRGAYPGSTPLFPALRPPCVVRMALCQEGGLSQIRYGSCNSLVCVCVSMVAWLLSQPGEPHRPHWKALWLELIWPTSATSGLDPWQHDRIRNRNQKTKRCGALSARVRAYFRAASGLAPHRANPQGTLRVRSVLPASALAALGRRAALGFWPPSRSMPDFFRNLVSANSGYECRIRPVSGQHRSMSDQIGRFMPKSVTPGAESRPNLVECGIFEVDFEQIGAPLVQSWPHLGTPPTPRHTTQPKPTQRRPPQPTYHLPAYPSGPLPPTPSSGLSMSCEAG